MSAHTRPARKSTASTFSYAEAPSSGDEDEDEELSEDGREGGASSSEAKGPTKRTKGKAKAVEVDSGDEGDEDDQPRKKARGPAKGKHRKQKKAKGKLEVLKQLPVEMLTEIFSHLDTDGLLALSMVNKQYRSLLLAKSSTRLWKTARARLGLPDATAGGFTEWQYAELVFGKTCQECGAGKVARADFGIRKRLCRACRSSSMLRTDAKPFRLLDLHPLAKDCVIWPLHSPSQLKWTTDAPYAFIEDLEFYSDKLWEIERTIEHDKREHLPAIGRQRQARMSIQSSSYKETSDDEGITHTASRRAKDIVAARQPLLKQLKKEGFAMFEAAEKLREKIRRRQAQQLSFAERMKQMDRADQIAEKVLESDPRFDTCVFTPTFSSSKLVKREEPLTDAEWERIKPAILKLAERIKKKQDRDAMHHRLQDRQRSLRPRYDKLKDALPSSARPFVPLFIDFLVLSSVKALWQDEAIKLDDTTWAEHLDDIKDELDQYRLDIALHAHDLIVAAAHDPDEPSSPAPEEQEPNLSNDFWLLATSFVGCGIVDCHLSASKTGPGPAPATRSSRQAAADERAAPVGSLEEVLRHMHAWHNGDTFIAKPKRFNDEPRLPVSLSLEVSCAVGALLDLAKLDPATATADHLDAFTAIVSEYLWDNSPSHKSFPTMWRSRKPDKTWLELLRAVKINVDRAAKLSPPESLDPPVIACTLRDPRDWSRLPIRPSKHNAAVAAARGKRKVKIKREVTDDDMSNSSPHEDVSARRKELELEDEEEDQLTDDSSADESS
ncbi:uncharacterized protein RHOBADRAFT_54617 [Rhodotorula graminis WP1]|uniref:F-box domain-containing protein n=1 Tax=Rhodotorula graminis (strain WP1) TaxID=578459 RepID=A0A0P9GKV1_RHOGW|nr:uncharacterized protein RHOBADRAFT_54617 [Rhodotorula graminis WP1]KPV74052.1 hypothetical protein RHOBADRAFT_54617 [Rhodotorula graminis WP1]